MPTPQSEILHATTVAIDGRAVLLCGPSGAGKSDLALRLVDRGAVLVSDDQTIVTRTGDRLIAQAPATIAGQMEVRGIGIIPLPHVDGTPIAMRVALGPDVPRMPEPAHHVILGLAIPDYRLDPLTASAPIKVEIAVRAIAA